MKEAIATYGKEVVWQLLDDAISALVHEAIHKGQVPTEEIALLYILRDSL